MIKRLMRLNASGDTIVEVLIVLAVLSFSFGISYATATSGLNKSQTSEEHSETIGVLNSQVELLRAAVSAQNASVFPTSGGTFCMNSSDQPVAFATGYTLPASAALDSAGGYAGYPAACISANGLYHTSIVYNSAQNLFDVTVRWDGVGNEGPQQAEFTYRTYSLSPDASSGIPVVAQTPSIKVQVNELAPTLPANNAYIIQDPDPNDPNPTPSCNDTSTVSRSGVPVTLQQTNGTGTYTSTINTDGSSIADFQNLTDFGTYQASVVAPSGFGMCSSTSTPSSSPTVSSTYELLPPTFSQTINSITIYPQCHQENPGPIVTVTGPSYYHQYTATTTTTDTSTTNWGQTVYPSGWPGGYSWTIARDGHPGYPSSPQYSDRKSPAPPNYGSVTIDEVTYNSAGNNYYWQYNGGYYDFWYATDNWYAINSSYSSGTTYGGPTYTYATDTYNYSVPISEAANPPAPNLSNASPAPDSDNSTSSGPYNSSTGSYNVANQTYTTYSETDYQDVSTGSYSGVASSYYGDQYQTTSYPWVCSS